MTRKTREGSTQSRVLDAVASAEKRTIKEMQEILNLPGREGYDRITRACQDLLKAKKVERVGRGTYRALPQSDPGYGDAQRAMMRVVRIRTKRREPFSVRDLAGLSSCSREWTKRYLQFLVNEGLVEICGYTKAGKTNAPVYLAVEERLNEDWPVMRRQKKTAALDEAAPRLRRLAFAAAGACEANPASMEAFASELERIAAEARSFLGAFLQTV